MSDEPLTSSDQGKILIFIILLIPAIFFGAGVIPAIFLIFGIHMMKKSGNFSHVETAVNNSKIYIYLCILFCIILLAMFSYQLLNYPQFENGYDSLKLIRVYFALTLFAITVIYLVFLQKLFFQPLKNHENWVSSNGIFYNKSKLINECGKKTEVKIIKGEIMKSYSVADELTKWARLKEDGHISQNEYDEARAKLLSRN